MAQQSRFFPIPKNRRERSACPLYTYEKLPCTKHDQSSTNWLKLWHLHHCQPESKPYFLPIYVEPTYIVRYVCFPLPHGAGTTVAGKHTTSKVWARAPLRHYQRTGETTKRTTKNTTTTKKPSTQKEERDALLLTKQLPLDFDDAFHYYIAKKYHLTLVSFDRDFDSTDPRRSTPHAFL